MLEIFGRLCWSKSKLLRPRSKPVESGLDERVDQLGFLAIQFPTMRETRQVNGYRSALERLARDLCNGATFCRATARRHPRARQTPSLGA
jgi:hypothetical protein